MTLDSVRLVMSRRRPCGRVYVRGVDVCVMWGKGMTAWMREENDVKEYQVERHGDEGGYAEN